MSSIGDLGATRAALRELGNIAAATQHTLTQIIEDATQPSWSPTTRREAGGLSHTLNHLSSVREGFILSQRTSSQASMADLRTLVRDILLDWDWLHQMGLHVAPTAHLESVEDQVIAYNHALIAMAVTPHLPENAITFPAGRPTYADLTGPALPAETLDRIEEFERVIYHAEVMPDKELDYGPMRRTFAFFEATVWLVNNYLENLLTEQ